MLIETLSVKLQGDTSDFVAKMNSAGQVVSNLGDKMQQTGQRLQALGAAWSATITLPLAALGKASLENAAKFEQSMNIIEQVSGATTAQMKAMSDQALQLGKDTVFSANEAASAQLELAKAGFTVQQTMDALPGILNLASAANIEVAQAALVAGAAINAFNLDATESTRIADMLAAAANASSADVSDMALAFQQSTSAMALYGQTADATATAIALMANAGIRGSDAGTSLKVAMMRLAAPSSDDAKAMIEQLGIQVYDATGQMRDLRDILVDFERALGPGAKMVENYGGADKKLAEQAARAASAMGPLNTSMQEQAIKLGILQRELGDTVAKYGEGSTQVANKRLAILKLTNDLDANRSKYKEMEETLRRFNLAEASAGSTLSDVTEEFRNQALQTIFGTDAIRTISVLLSEGVAGWDKMNAAVNEGGMSQEVANARMKGLAGAIEYFKGTIDTLMIETALPWLNTLSSIIRQTADWIAKFGQLDPVLQKNIVIFLAMAAALGPVLFYAGMLFSVIGSLITVFSFLMNPLIVVGLAILSLLLPMDKVNKAFDTMRFTAVKALFVMSDGIMSALNAIERMFGINLSGVRKIVSSTFMIMRRMIMFGFFRTISELMGGQLNQWKQKFFEIGRVVKQWAIDFGKYIWYVLVDGDYLNDWITHLPEPIRSMARTFGWALSVIRGGFLRLVDYVRGALPGWLATLRSWGMAAWRWIVDVAMPMALQKLSEWAGAIWGWLRDHLPLWRDALWAWGVAAYQWIVDSIPVILAKLGEWAIAIHDYVKAALPGWLATLSEWKQALFQWIVDALPAALEELSYFVSLLYNNLKNGLIMLWPMLMEAGQILWQWIVETAPAVWTEIKNLFNALSAYVQEMLPTWQATLAVWGNAAWEWIVWAAGIALEKLGEWAGALYQWIADNLPIWKEKLLLWGNAAWEWITETAIPYTIEKLGEWGAWLYQWLTDNLPIWKKHLLLWANAAWEWVTETAFPYLREKLGELGSWLYQWLQENIPNFDAWVESVTDFALAAKEKFIIVKDYLMDVGKGFAKELPAMQREVISLGKTIGTEIPRILEHFNNLWSVLSGGRNGQAIGQFLGKFATTAIKALGTILTQVRAIMDAFDILVRATGAILSGDFATYWALKDQWNKAWADFGGATADQWQQFQSMWDNTINEVPAPTGPYLGTQPAGSISGNGVTITLNQSFSGNVDAAAVSSASQQGILAGLRQVGLA